MIKRHHYWQGQPDAIAQSEQLIANGTMTDLDMRDFLYSGLHSQFDESMLDIFGHRYDHTMSAGYFLSLIHLAHKRKEFIIATDWICDRFIEKSIDSDMDKMDLRVLTLPVDKFKLYVEQNSLDVMNFVPLIKDIEVLVEYDDKYKYLNIKVIRYIYEYMYDQTFHFMTTYKLLKMCIKKMSSFTFLHPHRHMARLGEKFLSKSLTKKIETELLTRTDYTYDLIGFMFGMGIHKNIIRHAISFLEMLTPIQTLQLLIRIGTSFSIKHMGNGIFEYDRDEMTLDLSHALNTDVLRYYPMFRFYFGEHSSCQYKDVLSIFPVCTDKNIVNTFENLQLSYIKTDRTSDLEMLWNHLNSDLALNTFIRQFSY